LIYGSDLSATDNGNSLAAKIAALADVDVASIDNSTGGTGAGADWVLEQMVGTVEATVPFSALLQNDDQPGLPHTITVNTTADVTDGTTSSFDALRLDPGADGAISLREAIIAANNQEGADTIILTAGDYNALFDSSRANYDILTSVTIIGDDASTTSINGTGNTNVRVLKIHTGGNGGGAINTATGATTSITNSILIDNNVTGGGGGLRNDGTTTVESSLIQGNASENGGGLPIFTILQSLETTPVRPAAVSIK